MGEGRRGRGPGGRVPAGLRRGVWGTLSPGVDTPPHANHQGERVHVRVHVATARLYPVEVQITTCMCAVVSSCQFVNFAWFELLCEESFSAVEQCSPN